jgi:hypothetical protein
VISDQQPLTTIPAPPRPKLNAEMRLAAARVLAGSVSNINKQDANEVERLATDIAEYGSMDGFELGKALDRRGWYVDAAMVEELDSYSHHLHEALRKAEAEWAAKYNIQPPHPVGTMTTKGEITDIDKHSPASYQVKPADQDDAKGYRRLIIKFEDAQLAQAEVPA